MLGSIFRIVVILLSIASFIPQCRKINLGADSSGISLYYVLFNLIAATHQFFLGFLLYATFSDDNPSYIIHGKQPTVLDWLNLVQFTAVLCCFLVLFILCLIYPSNQPLYNSSRYTVVSLYIVVLLLYATPHFITLGTGKRDREFFLLLWYYYIFFIGNYFITALGIASLFFQWPYATSLDPLGLLLQVAAFTLVAISWVLLIPYDRLMDAVWWNGWADWYPLIGFTVVDSIVFAIVQAVLYYKVWRGVTGVTGVAASGSETEPLLGSVGGAGT